MIKLSTFKNSLLVILATLMFLSNVQAQMLQLFGAANARYLDSDLDGVYESETQNPEALGIREFNDVVYMSEKSVIAFDAPIPTGRRLESIEFTANILSHITPGAAVNIIAFVDDLTLTQEDATKAGLLVGQYVPEDIGLDSFTVALDVEKINSLFKNTTGTLNLRLEGAANRTNTAISAIGGANQPVLSVSYVYADRLTPVSEGVYLRYNGTNAYGYPLNIVELSLYTTSDTTEVSLVNYDLIELQARVAQSATVEFDITRIRNGTSSVDIYAFNDDLISQYDDHSAPATLVATFDPSELGYGSHVVELDPYLLNPLLIDGNPLTLRFSSDQVDADVHLNSLISGSPPILVLQTTDIGEDQAAPVADAGSDIVIEPLHKVTLDAANSRDEVGIASIQWSQISGPAVTLYNSTSRNPYFHSPTVSSGNADLLEFQVTVEDYAGHTATDTVNVIVTISTTYLSSANFESIISDIDADGVFDLLREYPSALSVKKSSAEQDVSISAYYVEHLMHYDVNSAELHLNMESVTSDSFNVDIIGFHHGWYNDLADATTPGLVLASFDPSTLPLGENTIALDPAQLTTLVSQGLFLALRFSSSQLGAEMQFSTNPKLEFHFTPKLDYTPPIANAGIDQFIESGEMVALNGSESMDNVGIETFSWLQTAGTTVTLLDSTTAISSFVAPGLPVGVSEDLSFELKVIDAAGEFATDTVNVTVIGVDVEPPIAYAGVDLTVQQNALVTLDASGSTDNVAIVSYSWRQLTGANVSLSSNYTVTPQFTSPDIAAGVTELLTFEVAVSDERGHTSTDQVDVIVTGVDLIPPLAVAGEDFLVQQDQHVTLDASASTDNIGIVDYSWQQLSGPSVVLDTSLERIAEFNTPILSASESAELVFELTVTDEAGFSGSDAITVLISANEAPIANAGADIEATQYEVVGLDGSASLPIDDEITQYSWQQISGDAITLSYADTATPQFTAPKIKGKRIQTLVFELTVVDSLGLYTSDQVVVTVSR